MNFWINVFSSIQLQVLYNQSSEFSSMVQLKENFDGSISEVRDVIHEYFETSEQIPTVGNLHFEKENNEYLFEKQFESYKMLDQKLWDILFRLCQAAQKTT